MLIKLPMILLVITVTSATVWTAHYLLANPFKNKTLLLGETLTKYTEDEFKVNYKKIRELQKQGLMKMVEETSDSSLVYNDKGESKKNKVD